MAALECKSCGVSRLQIDEEMYVYNLRDVSHAACINIKGYCCASRNSKTQYHKRGVASPTFKRCDYFWQCYSLKRFNNLWFCKWDPMDRTVEMNAYLKSPCFLASNNKCFNSLSSFWIFECIPWIFSIWDPNDRTVKGDSYLKSPTFPASDGKCYNFRSSFWIFECIPRIFGIWDPNDRTAKVDTYSKRPTFSASNAKCYNSLGSFRIFECILRVWVLKRTQKSHEINGEIFEQVRIVCVECNELDSLLDYRLGKKQNWQLGFHDWKQFLCMYKNCPF